MKEWALVGHQNNCKQERTDRGIGILEFCQPLIEIDFCLQQFLCAMLKHTLDIAVRGEKLFVLRLLLQKCFSNFLQYCRLVKVFQTDMTLTEAGPFLSGSFHYSQKIIGITGERNFGRVQDWNILRRSVCVNFGDISSGSMDFYERMACQTKLQKCFIEGNVWIFKLYKLGKTSQFSSYRYWLWAVWKHG